MLYLKTEESSTGSLKSASASDHILRKIKRAFNLKSNIVKITSTMQSSSSKKILAISGSLRSGSSNHAILRFLGEMAPTSLEYIIYHGLAQLPHFDPDLDNDHPPATVSSLRKLLAEADGIIICTPEYAYGVPGSLKNALDWTVSSGSLNDKSLALVTASTGGQNAHAALLLILGALNANVLKEATLLIPFIRFKMDTIKWIPREIL